MDKSIIHDVIRPRNTEEEAFYKDHGFRWGQKGTHTSRTIMLEELRLLLSYCQHDATREEYMTAILEDNCLGKKTAATRRLTGQRLSELYGLDSQITLFRVLRYCWYAEPRGQRLLALLLSLARDPLLRITAAPVLKMQPGVELSRQRITDALNRAVGDRLSDNTLDKVVRNSASSWTQSGHLKGHSRKMRVQAEATPASTAYALFVGHLAGIRTENVFDTLWSDALDAPPSETKGLAFEARRQGYLDMSDSGGVINIAFPKFLSTDERPSINGQN